MIISVGHKEIMGKILNTNKPHTYTHIHTIYLSILITINNNNDSNKFGTNILNF